MRAPCLSLSLLHTLEHDPQQRWEEVLDKNVGAGIFDLPRWLITHKPGAMDLRGTVAEE